MNVIRIEKVNIETKRVDVLRREAAIIESAAKAAESQVADTLKLKRMSRLEILKTELEFLSDLLDDFRKEVSVLQSLQSSWIKTIIRRWSDPKCTYVFEDAKGKMFLEEAENSFKDVEKLIQQLKCRENNLRTLIEKTEYHNIFRNEEGEEDEERESEDEEREDEYVENEVEEVSRLPRQFKLYVS
jgi:hypoxanthine-guanine phosphoribosyltransferase